MKIMLDTNVIISAIVFGGRAKQVITLLQELNQDICVSEYVEDELKNKLEQKWPTLAERSYLLYRTLNFRVLASTSKTLGFVRDIKDIPVLSDAIYHEVDILLTGDKDFLDLGIKKPLILSPTSLVEYFQSKNE